MKSQQRMSLISYIGMDLRSGQEGDNGSMCNAIGMNNGPGELIYSLLFPK